jgi:hypothetical protein
MVPVAAILADAAVGDAAAVSECRNRPEQNPERQENNFHSKIPRHEVSQSLKERHFSLKPSRKLIVNYFGMMVNFLYLSHPHQRNRLRRKPE